MSKTQDIASFIHDELFKGIMSLEIMPGSTLKESDICKAFNASRTPVREALMRLSEKSLVDILPYKDNRVSLINMKNIKQLLYARAAVEERLIKDFISLNNPLLIEDMDHTLRRQQITISQKNYKLFDFLQMDMDFHHIWYRATDNEAIFEFFSNHEDYMRLRILDMKTGKDCNKIIEEHKKIEEIIINKDLDNLYPAILEHRMGCYNRTLEKERIKPSGYLCF